MPTTSRLALPYPTDADNVDVAGDIQALADRLDLIGTPTYTTTSLPSSPADGDEIFFAADATNGVIWHLRYRSGASGSYKWEFVGGPPLISEVATSESTTSTTYANLTTTGPTVTLPLAGDYIVDVNAAATHSLTTGHAYFSYAIGASAASDTDAAFIHVAVATGISAMYRQHLKTGLTAVALTSKYKTNSGTLTLEKRCLSVRPVRVG